jgi:hypothetical protein
MCIAERADPLEAARRRDVAVVRHLAPPTNR